MGATIPMLTQVLSRDLEDASRLHAFVYATNTVGATAGFVLVPWLGLARVMFAMGAINLLAGAVFELLAAHAGAAISLVQEQAAPHRAGAAAYAFAALLVGFAMMAIQTILNRLGALSLGASEFTFATVVAANVLCIAPGSFAVARLRALPRALLWNQWLGKNPFREVSELLEGPPPPRYVDAEQLTALYAAYYEPHVGFSGEALLRAWAQCGPPAHSAGECRRGAESARALLEKGTAAARER